jgi:Ni/Co efflux regulator RcnB
VRRLPPPPRDYEHVLIGGHVVLLNRKTFFVLSVIHVEIP